ncbi:uncharacterized protein LOC111254862 [Varroa destructor]|uniref:Uncharacterized protein n=1 Tax=Varroa destructor TaxID=109461 RepID=A0A7M7KTV8_VARDE|nr:uncharacterized protein LOC111254862 [Varroa destructor]XP_022671896.1 uncharacterized protein LOC111254862 [Varroa destructor]XP_022671897.1 uncharacterized protein LOC111254862 [Varroa destructor]
MEELKRYENCLGRLQEAAALSETSSVEAFSYRDFLRNVQELRRHIALQTMEAKGQLALIEATCDRLRDEIPEALSLVAPHRLGEFRRVCQKSFEPKTPVKVQTPLSGRKKLSRDAMAHARKLIDRETTGNMTPKSPKIRTPVSARKVVLNKSFLPHTYQSIHKKTYLSALKHKLVQSPSSTPQLPMYKKRSKMPLERKSATKTLIASLSKFVSAPMRQDTHTVLKEELKTDSDTPKIPRSKLCKVESVDRRAPIQMCEPVVSESIYPMQPTNATLGSSNINTATPEMKQRIMFFNNPNVESIHQRYVAIQDSEELTCLLPTKAAAKQSTTPERPIIRPRKTNMPLTPPRPLLFDLTSKKSVTPTMPTVRRPSEIGLSTGGKSATCGKKRMTKTPSPPCCTSRGARLCLAAKLDNIPNGQNERTLEALAISSQQAVIQKTLVAEDCTPEMPSSRMTFKPSLVERSVIASDSKESNFSENCTAIIETAGVQADEVPSVCMKKTPELRQCFQGTLLKTPVLQISNNNVCQPKVYKIQSTDVKGVKVTNRVAHEVKTVQTNSVQKKMQPPSKDSENKLKIATKTPVKFADNRTLLKTPAKTPRNQVLSVSLRTNEKLTRPSKMQRQATK